jgi:monoamine oxidase
MTDAGTISARASIVTVPVGVLASGAIRFTPELPADTRDGLGGLGMGALTKAGLSFGDARFDLPANSSLWDSLGPRAGFAFDCFAYDQNVVVAYFGGDHARELLHAGERQTLALLLERFVNMVGSDARKSFVGGRVHGWCTDPWSMGCYSVARPGQAGAREKLARPVAERLWFAGEATAAGDDGSFGAAMTAGGAYLAGVAAARAAAKA